LINAREKKINVIKDKIVRKQPNKKVDNQQDGEDKTKTTSKKLKKEGTLLRGHIFRQDGERGEKSKIREKVSPSRGDTF
jgi:hypothetical protein